MQGIFHSGRIQVASLKIYTVITVCKSMQFNFPLPIAIAHFSHNTATQARFNLIFEMSKTVKQGSEIKGPDCLCEDTNHMEILADEFPPFLFALLRNFYVCFNFSSTLKNNEHDFMPLIFSNIRNRQKQKDTFSHADCWAREGEHATIIPKYSLAL